MSIQIRATLDGVHLPFIEIPYVPEEQGTDLRNRVAEAFNSSASIMIQKNRRILNSVSVGEAIDPVSPIFVILGHAPEA
jgi:hypothetical protein